jgi:two-component system, sensor histidine kinase
MLAGRTNSIGIKTSIAVTGAIGHWLERLAEDAFLPGKDMSPPMLRRDPANRAREAFVFRDFEQSKVCAIRDAIARSPVKLTAAYFAMVLFWTIMMSAGAGIHGNNDVILNLTPHVALYAAILGFFLYPLHLAWVPLLCFAIDYAYPFFQPLVHGLPWYMVPAVTVKRGLDLFLLNLASGLAIGLLMRGLFSLFNKVMRAHFADLLTSLVAMAAFVGICTIQATITLRLLGGLDAATNAALGINEQLASLAQYRLTRGGVVVTAFLLAAIEPPNRAQLTLGLIVSTIFPLMVLVQAAGFVLYPALDVALVAILVAIFLPVPSAIMACIVGVPIYSALTGQFLNDIYQEQIAFVFLDRYSIAALFLIVLVLAFRSMSRHLLQVRDGSMRRLYRVRDFAGLGLFSANVTAGSFRLDSSASNLLDCPISGPIGTFLQCFDVAARDQLTCALSKPTTSGDVLILPLQRRDGAEITLRFLIWVERAASGEEVAYGLMLDVSEETNRKEALQKALDALSLREATQRQLFSIVSHEVRTPASVISMLIDELPVEAAPSVRSRLRETADHLLSVLGDMRQAVNPEKNLPIRHEAYVPAKLAGQVINGLHNQASKAQIALRLQIAEADNTPREGDCVRLQQVLTNLIRNGLIHSNGSLVTLRFQSEKIDDEQALSIWTVSDNGEGIDPADEEAIFQPFERGGKDSRKRADGSGLGLYIARSAIELLGGTLTYQRQPEGGSAFVVNLPEKLLPDCAREQAALPPPKADSRLSVVLAEDNPIVAEVMVNRLKRDFPKLRLVSDGKALLEACAETAPDVVLTDLFMPSLDGDEATAALRQRGFAGPIIGLTAAAVGEEAEQFLAAGANAVLFKPLDMTELHRLLLLHLSDPPSQAGAPPKVADNGP